MRISNEIVASHGIPHPHLAGTELVLLEVDPARLHAYWHIEHADLFRARTAAGDPCASLVLRLLPMTEHTDGAAAPTELPVKGLTDSGYLEAPLSGAPCFAEIGLKLRDGMVRPLVRSNLAHPPRKEESPDYAMVPIDTRIRQESPPEDARIGESMSAPLPSATDDGSPPGSSWS